VHARRGREFACSQEEGVCVLTGGGGMCAHRGRGYVRSQGEGYVCAHKGRG